MPRIQGMEAGWGNLPAGLNKAGGMTGEAMKHDLRKIAERLNKITPWPWHTKDITPHSLYYIMKSGNEVLAEGLNMPDAEFIAKAPEYIAALIDALVEERAALIHTRITTVTSITIEELKPQAITELGLDGVRPVKGKV